MIEHVISSLMEDLEKRRYQAYVTDALMVITENTAQRVQGKYLTHRWAEKFMPKDTRSGDEIVADIIQGAGLTVQGGEPNGFIRAGSASGVR